MIEKSVNTLPGGKYKLSMGDIDKNDYVINEKSVFLAQDLKKEIIKLVGLKLIKQKNGCFIKPNDNEVINYLNNLAKEEKIRHWRVYGEHCVSYFFDPYDIQKYVDVVEKQPYKNINVVRVQCTDKITSETDDIPYEISNIESLYKIESSCMGSCVYFLCRFDRGKNRNVVVYVGQTVNLPLRITEHKRKIFDHVYYIRVPANQLNEVEAALISYLKPEYNIKSLKQTKEVKLKAKSILNNSSNKVFIKN